MAVTAFHAYLCPSVPDVLDTLPPLQATPTSSALMVWPWPSAAPPPTRQPTRSCHCQPSGEGVAWSLPVNTVRATSVGPGSCLGGVVGLAGYGVVAICLLPAWLTAPETAHRTAAWLPVSESKRNKGL